MLADLLQSAPAHWLAFSEDLGADGPRIFAAIDAMGLEGIVSKRSGSRYKSGDSDLWVKTKTFTEGDFEVLGADLSPTGAPVAILARRSEHGLHYVGDAFITLKAADREDFWAYVEANTLAAPVLPLKRRGTWLKPGLAARVKHLRGDGILRHATLKGLRDANH
jgi:ATP-dependent DNA ligase